MKSWKEFFQTKKEKTFIKMEKYDSQQKLGIFKSMLIKVKEANLYNTFISSHNGK